MEQDTNEDNGRAEPRPRLLARAVCSDIDDVPRPMNLLTPAQESKLGKIATIVTHRRTGCEIFASGTPAAFIYIVDRGLISIGINLDDGARQVLDFARAGDLIGHAHDDRYVNTAETLTAATLFQFPRAAFTRLLLDDPELQSRLLAKTANDLLAAQRRLVALGRASVYRRVAAFLFQSCQAPDLYAAKDHLLRLPMNRFCIADYLGTTPESVARSFGALEGSGIIRRRTPKSVEIRDRENLGRIAAGLY